MPPGNASNSNVADNVADNSKAQEPLESDAELPKIWDVKDPYQFAAPKPDEDPWTMLVEPLLRKDKMQCDAWKDEVQNLLIFAGLFSAIVTAFIVESYKNLQPDPSDAIVSLLSQIASRLDGPLNTTSVMSSSPAKAHFAPEASAIRVNTFWFLSLVLSLATVLTGIISLQWLREHLVYADLSPREKYATYNMRAEGLKKWHVGKVFTTMPVLLQCALVLFLGGIIDFLHAIGYWNVTIPVAIVVSLTLMFLVATTLLPCLQIMSLYVYLSPSKGRSSLPQCLPSQCPYKSPQSHATLALFRLVSPLCTRLYPYFHTVIRIVKQFTKLSQPDSLSSRFQEGKFTRYLRQASQVSPWWIDFDEAWLNIRDAYMRRALGRELSEELFLGRQDPGLPPMYDVVDGLLSQSWQMSSAIPAYHCFIEASTLTNPYHYHHHDIYLHGLLSNEESLKDDICLFEFSGDWLDRYVSPEIIQQQNIFLFLRSHNTRFPEVQLLSTHRIELGVRLMAYFYQTRRGVIRNGTTHIFPSCLSVQALNIMSNPISYEPNNHCLVWQIGNLALALLHQLEGTTDGHPPSNIITLQNYLAALIPVIAHFTTTVLTIKSCKTPTQAADPLLCANERVFESIPDFLAEQITVELSQMPRTPSALFYLAVLYCHSLTHQAISLDPCITSLQSTLSKYIAQTVDKHRTDPDMETRLGWHYEQIERPWDYQSCGYGLFSADFWSELAENPQWRHDTGQESGSNDI